MYFRYFVIHNFIDISKLPCNGKAAFTANVQCANSYLTLHRLPLPLLVSAESAPYDTKYYTWANLIKLKINNLTMTLFFQKHKNSLIDESLSEHLRPTHYSLNSDL